MEKASMNYSKDFLWTCTLYTTAEPCAMCTGAIYWGNVGRIAYGMSETADAVAEVHKDFWNK